MSLQLEVVADDLWAGVVGTHLGAEMTPGSRLCLATGATTRPLYGALPPDSSSTQVEVFLLDEFGGLDIDDPGRCEAMIRRDLVDSHPVSELHVPDVDSLDPEGAAARYGAELRAAGIDLALVGLGRNGHVGMNEPGSSARSVTRVVSLEPSTSENARAYGAARSPDWGITVGMAELLAARSVWLVVTGEHKATVLAEALRGPVTPELPASQLREHPDLVIWADESAARQLSD